jgi:hypothetical protein
MSTWSGSRAYIATRLNCLQGRLDLLILRILQWGLRHGYGISQAIRTASGDVLRADTGSPKALPIQSSFDTTDRAAAPRAIGPA